MIVLPRWMRTALAATAVMNVGASAVFLPPASALRAFAGLPEPGHPLYPTMVAMFVLLFGLGYLWAAVAGRVDRLFLGVAAIGKLSAFALSVGFWAAGLLPPRTVLVASADLLFGALFVVWLLGTRAEGARVPLGREQAMRATAR